MKAFICKGTSVLPDPETRENKYSKVMIAFIEHLQSNLLSTYKVIRSTIYELVNIHM